jgi:hypothetical protein
VGVVRVLLQKQRCEWVYNSVLVKTGVCTKTAVSGLEKNVKSSQKLSKQEINEKTYTKALMKEVRERGETEIQNQRTTNVLTSYLRMHS